jgi:hypothetical protein
MPSWMDYFTNPRGHYLKKTMFDVLKERYAQNEQIIERMGVTLLTESDLNAFIKMIGDVYEIAYMRAVNDHREQLQKAGLVARIVPPNGKS